jgi:hypothetical protein
MRQFYQENLLSSVYFAYEKSKQINAKNHITGPALRIILSECLSFGETASASKTNSNPRKVDSL